MRRACCFAAGFVLALCVLLTAVLVPALSTPRFERALISTVNQQALGVSVSDLSAFAEETMRFLRGEQPLWQPVIPREGIPDAFVQHMHEVRAWVCAAPWVIFGGAAVSVLLLLAGGRMRKPVFFGIGSAVALLVCVLLWAVVDFHSLWMIVHRFFIPGGIFSASEPVMQLFPLGLFFQYVVPVAAWAAGGLAALFAGVWAVTRKPHPTAL